LAVFPEFNIPHQGVNVIPARFLLYHSHGTEKRDTDLSSHYIEEAFNYQLEQLEAWSIKCRLTGKTPYCCTYYSLHNYWCSLCSYRRMTRHEAGYFRRKFFGVLYMAKSENSEKKIQQKPNRS